MYSHEGLYWWGLEFPRMFKFTNNSLLNNWSLSLLREYELYELLRSLQTCRKLKNSTSRQIFYSNLNFNSIDFMVKKSRNH